MMNNFRAIVDNITADDIKAALERDEAMGLTGPYVHFLGYRVDGTDTLHFIGWPDAPDYFEVLESVSNAIRAQQDAGKTVIPQMLRLYPDGRIISVLHPHTSEAKEVTMRFTDAIREIAQTSS